MSQTGLGYTNAQYLPPMIVFGAEVEIAEQNSGLTACDDQNSEYQKQESKHIIHLIRPNAVQYEEELNEDTAERQNAAHNYAGQGLSVNRLLWDLTRDLIGADRMLDCSFLEAEVGANKS